MNKKLKDEIIDILPTRIRRLFNCIGNKFDSLMEIRAYDMYYDNLDEYLSIPKKLREGAQKQLDVGEHTIEFQNVSFRYPGSDKYALQNVSITIRSGQKLSIVGENGAGKSTFVKLLT